MTDRSNVGFCTGRSNTEPDRASYGREAEIMESKTKAFLKTDYADGHHDRPRLYNSYDHHGGGGISAVLNPSAPCFGMLGSPKKILNVFIKSTPIIFTGVGVAFAIKTGLFNIGAEGQFIMGSIGAV